VEFKDLGDFFEASAKHTQHYKGLANWLMGDITALLKADKNSEKLTVLASTKLTPQALAQLVALLEANTISTAIAKKLLPILLQEGGMPAEIAQEKGMVQLNDEAALKAIISDILLANPKNVTDYQSGKDKLFGFFVGQVMKATQGNANPELLNTLLKTMLTKQTDT
jgi:aspartyl-tRNA(Asn)/glutamyl-tRNA(Gln) amidotransferase subunit B